jgi:predicted DNA-binding antitoxin AbrB/MazE fold protein
MEKRLQAVYENGVLRPLESLRLSENQRVTVAVYEPAQVAQDVSGYFSTEEWDGAAHDGVTLEEVRCALSTVAGSLSDAVIAQREER